MVKGPIKIAYPCQFVKQTTFVFDKICLLDILVYLCRKLNRISKKEYVC